MPGRELNRRLPSPAFENIEMMGNDGSSEYLVDPSLYYPAAATYGYYYTGFESQPGEWDDQHVVYGLDGTDTQYTGAQSENLPYAYYAPSYGFGEPLYNPYNPYIPGAMFGVDGSFVGTQPYYAVSPYSSPTSSDYYPILVQSGTDIVASTSRGTIPDALPSEIYQAVGSTAKRLNSSSNATLLKNSLKGISSQSHVIAGASQASKYSTGTSKRPTDNQNGAPIGSVNGGSSHVSEGGNFAGSLQSARNISYGKLLSHANQVKNSFSLGDYLSEYNSNTSGKTMLNDPCSKFYYGGLRNDSYSDQLGEQNRGPRTNKSKNEIVVKAYTTKAGVLNAEGNIVISANQYNKNDFPMGYPNAKFFVIKSYSEDDVHKSIKYNVWSSTINGNRKLSSAYEDAQKIGTAQPRGCPIFLFFSVNASGQFCGVAEMVGPVDFDKDMDFWQQDKWSGSFPVKWHFVKDVPNNIFRHIILENNEHKPVTNSRDTQEIMIKPGLEMLKLFQDYSSKTSLLDDFMYYENRQKIMHEERTRRLRRANGHAHPAEYPLKFTLDSDHSQKLGEVGTWVEKGAQISNPSGLKSATRSSELASTAGGGGDCIVSDLASMVPSSSEVQVADMSTLKIGSLSIHPKPSERPSQASATGITAMPKTANAPANIVTLGSMPNEVDGANKSSKMLTIGTIAFDPKALVHGKVGGSGKGIMRK